MKSTFLCLVAVAAFAVSSRAQDASTFPKVGTTYDAIFADDARASETFRLSGSEYRLKVLSAGSGSWFRVEYDEPDNRPLGSAPGTPHTTHKHQKWINFAFVVSAQEVAESK